MRVRIPRGAWATAPIVIALLAMLLLVRHLEQPVRRPANEAQVAQSPQPYFSEAMVDEIVRPVVAQIEAGAFPGAAVVIGHGGNEWHARGFGALGWRESAAAVDPRTTMYDLASMTKVLATVSAVLLLVDEGRMTLDDRVGSYLPEFAEGAKSAVTIRHLLTHTSGLPAGAELRQGNRRERIARALTFPIHPPVGRRAEYSDIGFIVLWELAERVAGEPLTGYLERKLYRPLGMNSTGFAPGLDCEVCAPTGRLRDQTLYRGIAFDPLAQRLDGVSGHAGLFSTAEDIARFTAMLMNGGTLDGVRVLSPEMAAEFIAVQPYGNRFRLGWDALCAGRAVAGGDGESCDLPRVIGHTGWTGTSLWIDPESGVWVVLLTNRTYEPRAPNEIQRTRRELFTRARGYIPSDS